MSEPAAGADRRDARVVDVLRRRQPHFPGFAGQPEEDHEETTPRCKRGYVKKKVKRKTECVRARKATKLTKQRGR